MSPTDSARRHRARLRQARKRQRDREERLDLQALVIAERMPVEWRAEWLEYVQRNRARKARVAVEVEQIVPLISESGRAKFVARNRPHTKVSLAELRNRFYREKAKVERFSRRDLEWRAKHYMDNEIAGYEGECHSDRYPGSPPIGMVKALAARHVPGSTAPLDPRAMAIQQAGRLAVAAYKTLPVELRLLALQLPF
jgi:hypothetical protein